MLPLFTGLLRADRTADLRNERIPSRAVMTPPWHKYTGVVPASGGPTGYTPAQMRHAYGFDGLNTTGQGQVIAIVDAYGSPTIQSDLNTFCAAFGIPSTTVMVYFPQGTPTADSGWAEETSLDVEWAHAIAPGATIVLVASQSNADTDLFAAVDFAASLPGVTQVSLSWGGPEYSTEMSSDFHFNVPGVTFFASSGDSGAGVEYPASSPYIVAVGGTTLSLDSSGNITSETAWSGSGGGASVYETVPNYQAGWWSGPGRGVPDVAYDADPNTGVPIYLTGFGWQQFGGTSAGAPQWAALSALANSLRAQSINSAPGVFYSLATANYPGYYHDIISGSNGAYSAGPGYDLVTGLGSPLANQLVIALAGGYSSQAAAPAFTPAAGAYASAQNVTIVSATPGASIRYTTDGSTPTETFGTLYSGPVSIGANATLAAIAFESGLTDSPVTSGGYTFLPQVAEPMFNPAAGTYNYPQVVAISTMTAGASIRYTTDGSTPTESYGILYSGPVSIASMADLQAIAYKTGSIESPMNSGAYTITNLKLLANLPADGEFSYGGVMLAKDGNFYGTSVGGGSASSGTVFKVTPAGVLTTLVSFDGATQGGDPWAGLVQGSDGNFYGTTIKGGSNNYGTVFKLTPAGVLTTLHSFNATDGFDAYAGLVQGSDGNFYGTTEVGGSSNIGTVFKITPAGVFTTLVSFDGTNGNEPAAALVQGSDGNFYGTTLYGGENGFGSIFKMTPAGVLTTLASFDNTNGDEPGSALVQGSDGNFYGTTYFGGIYGDAVNPYSFGTVFKVTPTGILTSLLSFDGINGDYAYAGLVQGRDGNFYGTTVYGGSAKDGNIFKITPAGVLTIMGVFDPVSGAGIGPFAGLVQGKDGNFYGTAGGATAGSPATVFQLVLPPQVAAPTFSPAAGTYTSAQLVTITSATSGATIVYTTDGSIPSETNGTLYSGPVTVGTATTLTAIAYKVGLTDSNITSGNYTISVTLSSGNGFYNTPMSSPQSGTFTATFDASTSLSPSNTAIALCKGNQTAYTGLSCIARFNPSGDIDAYNGTGYQAASVIPYAKNTTYHFRMVVNVPANTYSVYVTPPGGSEVLVGSNYGFRHAATSLDTWTIDVNSSPGGSVTVSNLSIIVTQQVAAPTFSPPAGTYTSAQSVTITSATSGALIAYTTDGTTPTESGGTVTHGTVLSNGGSVSISAASTLKAFAFKGGLTDSTVTSGLYAISLPQVAVPTFNPPAGTYTSAQSVTIASTTSGASIAYTTDGSTPTESGGTVTHGTVLPNGGSVSIGVTTTLEAMAYKTGMTDSAVATGLYTIGTPQVIAPTFSPPSGTYTSAQSVTIVTATGGASIRYTTDNSTPTETNGTLYSSPVSIGVTTTLKAMAFESGMADSAVTAGLYTINVVTRSLTGSSGDGWHALALTAAQTGTFTATFDATPTVSPENALVGLSMGAATGYSNLSCIARFNPSGQIDSYNSTGYQAASVIPYAKNTTYHFRLVVNVPANTYSVYVTPPGGSELTVGLNYGFRAKQTSLDTWNLDVNSTPSGCSLTANNLNP